MTSEKFCVKSNDFQHHIVSSYQDFREDSDFYDVTLVCEGNQQIEAHRIILTACSPFFSRVLKGNKNYHPMIFMRGVQAMDLAAVVDFIYYGEANIYHRDLDGFLALATDLNLKGLECSRDNVEPIAYLKSKTNEENYIDGSQNYNHKKAVVERKIITPSKDKSHSIDQDDHGTSTVDAADTTMKDLKLS